MLTGDTKQSANALASQINLAGLNIISSMRPIDKLNWVNTRKEEGQTVLVIGDGLNDGPMLSQAHVGVAMGECGTALAVESAGVCIMKDDLSKISTIIQIAKDCKSITFQNIVFSMIFKVLVIILNFTGHLQLWVAVVADVISLLVVMFNGIRLSFKKYNDVKENDRHNHIVNIKKEVV